MTPDPYPPSPYPLPPTPTLTPTPYPTPTYAGSRCSGERQTASDQNRAPSAPRAGMLLTAPHSTRAITCNDIQAYAITCNQVQSRFWFSRSYPPENKSPCHEALPPYCPSCGDPSESAWIPPRSRAQPAWPTTGPRPDQAQITPRSRPDHAPITPGSLAQIPSPTACAGTRWQDLRPQVRVRVCGESSSPLAGRC